MKKILTILCFVFTLSVFAQLPVINIIDRDGSRLDGAYYKDINNYLDAFEGEWLYTDNISSFRIVLEKKLMNNSGNFYEDLLIGGHQYIRDGIELVNTLPALNIDYVDQRKQSLAGNLILENNHLPICNDCVNNEKRVRIGIVQEADNMYGHIIVQKIMVNGNEALKIRIRGEGNGSETYGGPIQFVFPSIEYILLKQ